MLDATLKRLGLASPFALVVLLHGVTAYVFALVFLIEACGYSFPLFSLLYDASRLPALLRHFEACRRGPTTIIEALRQGFEKHFALGKNMDKREFLKCYDIGTCVCAEGGGGGGGKVSETPQLRFCGPISPGS